VAVTEPFTRTCGDRFVSAVDRGIRLYVTTQIRFASERSMAEFRGRMNASGNWGQVEASLRSLSREARRSASLSVTAYQQGGDPTRLGEIFAAHSRTGEQAASPVLTCSADALEACRALHESILHYGNVTLRTQVGSLSYQPGEPGPSAADLAYHLSPYDVLGLHGDPSHLSAAVAQLRQALSQTFEEVLRLHQRVQALRMSGAYALRSPRSREALEQASQRVQLGLARVGRLSRDCYEGREAALERSCAAAGSEAAGILSALKTELSPELQQSPAQLCQSEGCTHCANLGTEERPEFRCLACEWSIGEIFRGQSASVQGGTRFDRALLPVCASMQARAPVSIEGWGGYGNCSRVENGMAWWGGITLHGEELGANGAEATHSVQYIGNAVQAQGRLRVEGTVPLSGRVQVGLSSHVCQGPAGHQPQQSLNLDPDFRIRISQEALLLRHFGVAR
jgi:hypothetical protein